MVSHIFRLNGTWRLSESLGGEGGDGVAAGLKEGGHCLKSVAQVVSGIR